MTVFPMLAVSFFMNLVAIVFVICALVLMLIILIQKGRGGGLSAAFGGGLASGLLGSKTGDFLTWLTIAMVGIFLTLAVVMAKFYKPSISNFGANQPQSTQQMPVRQPPIQQLPTQQMPVQETPPQRSDMPQGSELPLTPAQGDEENADANSLGK